MPRYTTIFFDLDDTLWDTAANMRECLHDLYLEFGIERYYDTYADFLAAYRTNNSHLWELYSRHQIDKGTLSSQRFVQPFEHIAEVDERKSNEMNDYYLAQISCKALTVEGAIELLEYLKPNYKLHIISNGFTEMQYTKMDSAGLSSYFDKVILSDAVGINKPHPDIFTFAMTQAKTKPKESIMVGDSYFSDIEGAAASGIHQIWYNPNKEAAQQVKPTHTISHLSEIMDIL